MGLVELGMHLKDLCMSVVTSFDLKRTENSYNTKKTDGVPVNCNDHCPLNSCSVAIIQTFLLLGQVEWFISTTDAKRLLRY